MDREKASSCQVGVTTGGGNHTEGRKQRAGSRVWSGDQPLRHQEKEAEIGLGQLE